MTFNTLLTNATVATMYGEGYGLGPQGVPVSGVHRAHRPLVDDVEVLPAGLRVVLPAGGQAGSQDCGEGDHEQTGEQAVGHAGMLNARPAGARPSPCVACPAT